MSTTSLSSCSSRTQRIQSWWVEEHHSYSNPEWWSEEQLLMPKQDEVDEVKEPNHYHCVYSGHRLHHPQCSKVDDDVWCRLDLLFLEIQVLYHLGLTCSSCIHLKELEMDFSHVEMYSDRRLRGIVWSENHFYPLVQEGQVYHLDFVHCPQHVLASKTNLCASWSILLFLHAADKICCYCFVRLEKCMLREKLLAVYMQHLQTNSKRNMLVERAIAALFPSSKHPHLYFALLDWIRQFPHANSWECLLRVLEKQELPDTIPGIYLFFLLDNYVSSFLFLEHVQSWINARIS